MYSETDLKYITLQELSLLLLNRLEVNQPAFGSSLGGQSVDRNLLLSKGIQKEALIDSFLAMIYEMPVPDGASDTKRILAGVVGRLVVAEILPVYFQQSQNTQMGGDAGYTGLIYRQAWEDFSIYLVGHGIRIPGLPIQPQSTALQSLAPVVLPGMRLKGKIPDTISRNDTLVSTRQGGKASEIDWGI